MTDRELLELAAKAANLYWKDWTPNSFAGESELREWPYDWNPLINDDDAFRLGIVKNLCLEPNGPFEMIACTYRGCHIAHIAIEKSITDRYEDRCAAMRRAIVRVVAEIGKEL